MKKQKHIGKKKGQVKLPVIKTNAKEVIKMQNMRIYTDSEYVINSINKWYQNWVKNGWLRSDKRSAVKNKYLIQIFVILL